MHYSAVNHSQHVFHYILRPYSSYKRILVPLMAFQPKPMEDPHHTSWEGSLPKITNVHVLCLQVLLIYGLHMFLTVFISAALPVMVLGTYSAITWVLNTSCLSFLPLFTHQPWLLLFSGNVYSRPHSSSPSPSVPFLSLSFLSCGISV